MAPVLEIEIHKTQNHTSSWHQEGHCLQMIPEPPMYTIHKSPKRTVLQYSNSMLAFSGQKCNDVIKASLLIIPLSEEKNLTSKSKCVWFHK